MSLLMMRALEGSVIRKDIKTLEKVSMNQKMDESLTKYVNRGKGAALLNFM